MNYLIDSDWVIDCLWGKRQATEQLDMILHHGVAISTISLAELFDGALGSHNIAQEFEKLTGFLEPFVKIPASEPIALRFAETRNSLRKRGMLISDMDIFIAATALDHDLTLLTRNVRHFSRVDGLRLHTRTI